MSESSTEPEKLSRRQFLGLGGGLLGAIALRKPIKLLRPEEKEENNFYQVLRERVRESSLIDEGKVSQERVLRFIDRAEEAGKFFREIRKDREKLSQILALTRKLFPNPDINIENQIFFLRDDKILKRSFAKMLNVDWKDKREKVEEEILDILTTPPMMNTLSDEVVPPESWPTTPENISKIYFLRERREPWPSIVVAPTEVPEGISSERVKELSKVVAKALEKVGNPPATKAVLLPANQEAEIPFWGHAVFDDKLGRASLELGILYSDEYPYYEEFAEDIVFHESAHALSIRNRIGLVRFLSPKELLDLHLLQIKADLDTYLPDSASVGRRWHIRGEKVDGRKIGKSYYREWIRAKVKNPQIGSGEWKILTHIYANDRWSFSGMLFMREPVYRLSDIQREMSSPEKQTIYQSWNEFFEGERKIFTQLASEDRLVEFVVEKIKERPQEFSEHNLSNSSASRWWADFWYLNFNMVIAEDLINTGEVKNYISEETYKKWIGRVPYELWSSLQERFADEVALYVYLQSLGQIPDWLEEVPAIKYYKEAKKILS